MITATIKPVILRDRYISLTHILADLQYQECRMVNSNNLNKKKFELAFTAKPIGVYVNKLTREYIISYAK